MPSAPPLPPPRKALALGRLLAVTLLVLLVHALLLGGMPSALSPSASAGAAPAATASFVTRTLPAEARAVPPVATQQTPRARAQPLPPAATPAVEAPSPVGNAATETAEGAPAEPPTPPAPAPAPAPAATPPLPSLPTLARTPDAAPVADAEAPHLGRVELPPAARLLYDGRGDERGFIQYSGTGEMLWEPDGAQYKAKLEISTWGVRVRTWTSKGTLGEAGLEPLRFGDKPRGAELATHFQRDKAIISFSANNPDVPLQMGAQDKLSALLQLSAMVAGAPEQLATGSSIRFQAADAHRAETWDFKVGTLEALELPGGALQALKLSKSPTVQYDQGIEVWLAPAMHYLPVRLRITEANGDFVDLQWRKTQKPDGS